MQSLVRALTTLWLAALTSLSEASTETLVALRGSDFVVLGADGSFGRSLVLLKQSQRKVHPLGLASGGPSTAHHKAVAVCGDAADCFRFVEAVNRELHLMEMSIGPASGFGFGQHYRAATRSAAQLARSQLLQQRAQVDAIVAGIDFVVEGEGEERAARARLLWLDRNGALQEMRTCAHGPSANLLWSLLDEDASEDMDQEAAVDLVRRCFTQLRGRYLVNTLGHQIYVLDRQGLRRVDVSEAAGEARIGQGSAAAMP